MLTDSVPFASLKCFVGLVGIRSLYLQITAQCGAKICAGTAEGSHCNFTAKKVANKRCHVLFSLIDNGGGLWFKVSLGSFQLSDLKF